MEQLVQPIPHAKLPGGIPLHEARGNPSLECRDASASQQIAELLRSASSQIIPAEDTSLSDFVRLKQEAEGNEACFCTRGKIDDCYTRGCSMAAGCDHPQIAAWRLPLHEFLNWLEQQTKPQQPLTHAAE